MIYKYILNHPIPTCLHAVVKKQLEQVSPKYLQKIVRISLSFIFLSLMNIQCDGSQCCVIVSKAS